ncbi:aspartyl/asparaginyl beta-hydroxylase domain-containing protein [Maritimibacter sp. 55A14]|uniref:aspartyl/asparaginyl beta-hydroxylase domain-containing protein n=1 Tax=Maritimibacter sp. 55A14 TaxID=2174844 RepID=UPI00130492E7|nr:aspartyl/asparaginyl beta-hydroxylase domain-containing protein [Maritimibacter sp. 55A14]
MASTENTTPTKPKTLNRPLRKFVKKRGKRAMRWASRVQSRASLVPDTPFVETDHFPFLAEFEDKWDAMRDEVRGILRHREAIPGFEEVSPDQYRIAQSQKWKTFVLYGFGQRLEKNARQAPVTAEILSRVPNVQTAWFSILAPGYHIPAHTGVTKGILRAHLGLIIPTEREKCRIRVDDEIRAWEAGKVIVLDDTYEHEVWNDTDEERVILLFDFDRPMSWRGRMLNRIMLGLMKFTAFYQEPKKNLADFEARFEAATRRADENLEKLSD